MTNSIATAGRLESGIILDLVLAAHHQADRIATEPASKAVARAPSVWWLAISALGSALAAQVAEMRIQAELRQLNRLGDRRLRDIGLVRAQLEFDLRSSRRPDAA